MLSLFEEIEAALMRGVMEDARVDGLLLDARRHGVVEDQMRDRAITGPLV